MRVRHDPEFCPEKAEFWLEPEFWVNLSFAPNAQKKPALHVLLAFLQNFLNETLVSITTYKCEERQTKDIQLYFTMNIVQAPVKRQINS